MSITSHLSVQREVIRILRERIQRREQLLGAFRMVSETLSERIDRLSRSAEATRSDEDLARFLNRAMRHLSRAVDRLNGEMRELDRQVRRLDSPGEALDQVRNRPVHHPLEQPLHSTDASFGETVLSHWQERREKAKTREQDTASVESLMGYNRYEVGEVGNGSFEGPSYSFLTVFVAALLQDHVEFREVTSAYKSDVGQLPSTRAAHRGLLGLTGILRSALDDDRSDLQKVRSAHVRSLDVAWETTINPAEANEDPLEALGWEDPVAMLPIRLETRFASDASTLKVRVYPSTVHVDSHEKPLTEEELEWGKAFWAQLWLAGLPYNTEYDKKEKKDTLSPEDFLEQNGETNFSTYLDDKRQQVVHRLFDQYDNFSSHSAQRFDQIRQRAWAQGTERFGHERAAYVVHALSPDTDDSRGRSILEGWSKDEDGNLQAPLTKPPKLQFPEVDGRPESWTQTPHTRLLPDRFVGYAYYSADDDNETTEPWEKWGDGAWRRRVGSEYVIRFTGNLVREPLPVGPSPEEVADADTTAGYEWMVDFEEAKKAGMGLTLTLESDELEEKVKEFTRLVVTGVRTSMNAYDTAHALEEQLDAAHYTSGIEFLSPGTPTNNADVPSGRTSRPDPADTAGTEVGPPLVEKNEQSKDGARLVRALGINTDTFAHVAGAEDTLGTDARAMNAVLWPATLGYFATNLWVNADSDKRLDGSGAISSEWLEKYRKHFVEHVWGEGPFPTLRVGRQPLGFLPASPMHVSRDDVPNDARGATGGSATTAEVGEGAFVSHLLEHLDVLARIWTRSAGSVPSVGADSTLSEGDLLSLLGREAVARTHRRRMWLLEEAHPISNLAEIEVPDESVVGASGLEAAGLSLDWLPRIYEMYHLGITLDGDDVAVSGDAKETLDRILHLLTSKEKFRYLWATGEAGIGDTLQAKIFRIAVLQAALASRLRFAAEYDLVGADPEEPNLSKVPPDKTVVRDSETTPHEALGEIIPDGVSDCGGELYMNMLSKIAQNVTKESDQAVLPSDTCEPGFARYVAALDHLESVARVDPDRVDRLFRSTMDLASHRLDAWWTSVATRRLNALRDRQEDAGGSGSRGTPPGGVHVGAFGFVENLSPEGEDEDAEYLLAPSMSQAETAAVLRAAYNGRAGDNESAPESLAINLSAKRVQRARELIEGVRNGLTLAELMGYRFERRLRDEGLEKYIHDYRALAPAVEGERNRGENGVDEGAKTSDVVDGRKLHQLYQQKEERQTVKEIVNSEGGLNSEGGDWETVEGIFEELGDSLDAVKDVLMAEAVHHLTHGRPDRASAAMNALSRGETIPELQVLDTPRTETNLTNRLAVLFGDTFWVKGLDSDESFEVEEDVESLSPGWEPESPPMCPPKEIGKNPDRPEDENGSANGNKPSVHVRNRAEPNLHAWVGSLLPGPEKIGCEGTFRWHRARAFATGAFEVPKKPGVVTVQDVGFAPHLIEMTVLCGTEANGTTSPRRFGWGYGVCRHAPERDIEEAKAVYATVNSDTNGIKTGQEEDCLFVEFPSNDNPSNDNEVRARVRGTTEDGFDVHFDAVGPAAGSVVRYQARRLSDPDAVEIGLVSSEQSDREDSDSDFDPDHVSFTGVKQDDSKVALSQGEAVRDEEQTLQQVLASQFNADGTPAAVEAVKENVVSFFGEHKPVDFDGGPPWLQSSDSESILYVATEFPEETNVPRPDIGQKTISQEEVGTVEVDVGFRPALVDVTIAVRTAENGRSFSMAYGTATGPASQGSLGLSRSSDQDSSSTLLSASSTRLAELQGEGGKEITIRLTGVSDDGFELEFPSRGNENLLLFYRAVPAEPDEISYKASMPVRLSDLKVTPQDAIFLTQGGSDAGDSQLERRMGYYCFRHRPPNDPPVPDDAELRLSFRSPPKDAAVSVADFIEVATTIRDVIGDGRALDAEDLSHPGEPGGKGYRGATVSELKDRADFVCDSLEDTKEVLENRVGLLKPSPNVCAQVDNVAQALREAVASIPFRQIADVAEALSEEYPSGNEETPILDELHKVKKRLRAGPIGEEASADIYVPIIGQESGQKIAKKNVSLSTPFAPGTKVDVQVRSYSDAVQFDAPKYENKIVQDGGTVSFNFNSADFASSKGGLLAGAAFTVALIPKSASSESDSESSEAESQSPGTKQSSGPISRVLASLTDLLRAVLEAIRGLFGGLLGDSTDKPEGDEDESQEGEGDAAGLEVEVYRGRIVDPSENGKWADLSRYLKNDAQFLPALLWLNSLIDDLVCNKGRALKRAIRKVDQEEVQKQLKLMEKLPHLYEGRAFTEDDLLAAKAISDVLDVDLIEIAAKIKEACRPLRWSGLTALVSLTGDRFRPDDQRYWRSASGSLDMLVEKNLEGEVRSRLEREIIVQGRGITVQGFSDPARLGGYSAPARHLGTEEPDSLKMIEALLHDPVAAVDVFKEALQNPQVFIHDLHRALHYGSNPSYEWGEVKDQINRYSATREKEWKSLKKVIEDSGVTLSSQESLTSKLVSSIDQFSNYLKEDRSAEDTKFQEQERKALERLNGSYKEQSHNSNGVKYVEKAMGYRRPERAFRAGVLEILRQGLLRASYFGIYGSTPASSAGGTPEDETKLLNQAQGVLKTVTSRLNAACDTSGTENDWSPGERVDTSAVKAQVDRLQSLLGEDSTVLPPFVPQNRRELNTTFANRDSLLGDQEYAPNTWLQQIARVREKPEAFQQLRSYADALDFAVGTDGKTRLRRGLTVGQLPADSGPWLGRADDEAEINPSGGEIVFGVEMARRQGDGEEAPPLPPPSDKTKDEMITGLFVDEWVTAVPDEEETIGVGIEYDDPNTRPPQTAILAVPPSWTEQDGTFSFVENPTFWTEASLQQTILETMEWMRRRSVDLETLQGEDGEGDLSINHVLPALYFPFNSAGTGRIVTDTPSVDFNDLDWI